MPLSPLLSLPMREPSLFSVPSRLHCKTRFPWAGLHPSDRTWSCPSDYFPTGPSTWPAQHKPPLCPGAKPLGAPRDSTASGGYPPEGSGSGLRGPKKLARSWAKGLQAPYSLCQLYNPCIFLKSTCHPFIIQPTDPRSPTTPQPSHMAICPAVLQPLQTCSAPPGHVSVHCHHEKRQQQCR